MKKLDYETICLNQVPTEAYDVIAENPEQELLLLLDSLEEYRPSHSKLWTSYKMEGFGTLFGRVQIIFLKVYCCFCHRRNKK